MRIAFITSEFVTDYRDGGGLGNYLNRMGRLLAVRGHEVEVFLPSALEPRVLMHNGIRVERIRSCPPRILSRLTRRIFLRSFPAQWFAWRTQARRLALAMERRHEESPFDAVQSADYLAVGLAVARKRNRIHLIRCSTAADLYNESDGNVSRAERLREELEREAMRRADRVYAPSRFVAEHYRDRHGIHVEVLRPPVALEVSPSAEPPCGLPERFMVHFGQFLGRKGTLWLGEALCRVFETDPSLRIVLAGRDYSNNLGNMLSRLGAHRWKVLALYPLPKPELYALLRKAEAAILPSLVDNLPNTVIESLMFGIPVVGTRGASIDELVEHGVTGELVAPRDVDGLAAAISRVWRGQSSVKKGFMWSSGVADEMQPDRAVARLLALASNR